MEEEHKSPEEVIQTLTTWLNLWIQRTMIAEDALFEDNKREKAKILKELLVFTSKHFDEDDEPKPPPTTIQYKVIPPPKTKADMLRELYERKQDLIDNQEYEKIKAVDKAINKLKK